MGEGEGLPGKLKKSGKGIEGEFVQMLLMLEFMMAILAVKLVIAVVIMRTRTVVEMNKRTN